MPKRQIKNLVTFDACAKCDDDPTPRQAICIDNIKTEFAAKLVYQFINTLRFKTQNGEQAECITLPFTDGDTINIANPSRDPNRRRRKSKRDRPLVFNEFMERSNDLLEAILDFDAYLNDVRLHGDNHVRDGSNDDCGSGSGEDQPTCAKADV